MGFPPLLKDKGFQPEDFDEKTFADITTYRNCEFRLSAGTGHHPT